MKISVVPAVLASVVILGLTTSSAQAQVRPGMPATASSPPSGSLAVIDVSKVYKDHIRFRNAMEAMKNDVKGAEDKLKGEKDAIEATMAQLRTFQPGTQNYKDLETTIAKQQGDFNVKATLQKKDFLEREGKIYNAVYSEMSTTVANYAASHGIAVVMRYASDPIDSSDRENILRGINKPLVYVAPGLDITQVVIDELNRGQKLNNPPQTATGPGNPARGPQR